MDLNNLIKNPIKFVKDINKLKEIVNILDSENLIIETSMELEKLKILNESIPNLKFNLDKHVNELDVMLNLSGNNKTKRDVENLIGKFMYLLTKHLWCLYLTDKITYEKLNEFYLNLYGTNIDKIQNEENILNSLSVSSGLTSSSGPIKIVDKKELQRLAGIAKQEVTDAQLVVTNAGKELKKAEKLKANTNKKLTDAVAALAKAVKTKNIVKINLAEEVVKNATESDTNANTKLTDVKAELASANTKLTNARAALVLANKDLANATLTGGSNGNFVQKELDVNTDMFFKSKYLKYKQKYIALKNLN